MSQPPYIYVRNLTHIFSSGQEQLKVLEGVSLEAEPGSFVSVVGPSGAGKTTLLRAMGGFLEPTRGSVLIGSTGPLDLRRKKKIGFVFQDPSLLPWRTVIDNIRLPLQVNSGLSNCDSEDPNRLLDIVGLTQFQHYYPHQLSGGMKQRVALARALVLRPEVLLMDEPLGALDEITRSVMRFQLLAMWELFKPTVIFVTHSIPEAVMLSDRVIVLSSHPARVLKEFTIVLPRPREQTLEFCNDFVMYVREIKQMLQNENLA